MDWECVITNALGFCKRNRALTQKQAYFCAAFNVITKATLKEYSSDPDYFDVVLEGEEDLSILGNSAEYLIEHSVLKAWRSLGFPVEIFFEAKKLHDKEILRCRKIKDIPALPNFDAISRVESIDPFVGKSYSSFQDFFGKSASFSEVWSKLPKFLEQEYAVAKHNKTRQIPVFERENGIAYEFDGEFKVCDNNITYWGLAACIYLVAGKHEAFPKVAIKTIKQLLVDNFGKRRLWQGYLYVPIYGATLTARLRQRGINEQATLEDIINDDFDEVWKFVRLCSSEALLFGGIPVDSGYIREQGEWGCTRESKISSYQKSQREEIFKSLLPFFPGLKEARDASRGKIM